MTDDRPSDAYENYRGERVTNIVDLEFTRRHRAATVKECSHKRFELDPNGQIVTCADCGQQVTAFWALEKLIDRWHRGHESLRAMRDKIEHDAQQITHLKAAKTMERTWRSRQMLPCCPHCHRGITPEDMQRASSVDRDFELARRQRENGK